MSDECNGIFTFVARFGRFWFKIMSLSLMNTPPTFQRVIESVLQDVSFFRVNIGDALIFLQSMINHLNRLRNEKGRVSVYSLKFKLSKWHFPHQEKKLVRHIAKAKGLLVYINNISPINETYFEGWNGGMINARTRWLISRIGRKIFCTVFIVTCCYIWFWEDSLDKWRSKMNASFNKFKKKFTPVPVLVINFYKAFIARTDAQSLAIGAE